MATFCTSCGTQQSGDAQFCDNCGVPIVRKAASAAATPPPAAPVYVAPAAVPEKSGKGFPVLLVGGGLVALLVIGGLVAVLFSGGNSPAKTASDFFWALEQGNTEEATSMMSSELRALLSEQKLNRALEKDRARAAKRGGLEDIEVMQETINEGTAAVRLKLIYADGHTDVQNMRLVLEDNDWKISADK
jgi:hypothetical protein